MERRTRSQITMGTSVKQFSVTHPTESSGHQAAVAGLDSVLAEAGTLEDQQREGIITERRGGAVRRGVIDRLWDVHLPHLWAAARRAEREQPDLARTFRLKPAKDTIAARRAAAGSMLEAAQTHKEVLVRYGMDESVLNDLVQGLAEFDAANGESRAADRTCDRALAAPALSGRMDRDDAWRQMAMLAGHWHLRGFGMWAVEERATPPDEVAAVAALLMGPDGTFITGSDFLMDGGVTAAYWYGELAPK